MRPAWFFVLTACVRASPSKINCSNKELGRPSSELLGPPLWINFSKKGPVLPNFRAFRECHRQCGSESFKCSTWEQDYRYHDELAATCADGGFQVFHVYVELSVWAMSQLGSEEPRALMFYVCLAASLDPGCIRDVFLQDYASRMYPHLVVRPSALDSWGDFLAGLTNTKKILDFASLRVEHAHRIGAGLDFAVIGFPLSGTTSLASELASHPEIFMLPEEDQVFWRPSLSSAEAFEWRRPYLEGQQKKQRHTENKVLLGLKEPMMIYQRAVMERVLRVPNIKVIILLRDSMAMLESWLNHGCAWETPFGDHLGLRAVLHAQFVKDLNSTAPGGLDVDRVLLLPSRALAQDPWIAYDLVFRFLGVSRLPKNHTFGPHQHTRRITHGCGLRKKCFSSCAHRSLREPLRAAFKLNAYIMEDMLLSLGWRPSAASMQPVHCTDLLEQSSAVQTGICRTRILSNCFDGDTDACQQCCEHRRNCNTHKWRACCAWGSKEELLRNLQTAEIEIRQELCGPGPNHRHGCCLMAGSQIVFDTP